MAGIGIDAGIVLAKTAFDNSIPITDATVVKQQAHAPAEYSGRTGFYTVAGLLGAAP
jgi:hypothetical protein